MFSHRVYLRRFQKTLRFVSNHASIKPALMAVQTLGTTGTGSHTNLILTRFDTKPVSFETDVTTMPLAVAQNLGSSARKLYVRQNSINKGRSKGNDSLDNVPHSRGALSAEISVFNNKRGAGRPTEGASLGPLCFSTAVACVRGSTAPLSPSHFGSAGAQCPAPRRGLPLGSLLSCVWVATQRLRLLILYVRGRHRGRELWL